MCKNECIYICMHWMDCVAELLCQNVASIPDDGVTASCLAAICTALCMQEDPGHCLQLPAHRPAGTAKQHNDQQLLDVDNHYDLSHVQQSKFASTHLLGT